jgi:hypothetical protein
MKPYAPTQSLVCPLCGSPIDNLAGVTPGHSQTVRKGQIVVCNNCINPSIVGDSGLDPLTQEKIAQLTPQTQSALKITLDGLRQIRGGGSVGFPGN